MRRPNQSRLNREPSTIKLRYIPVATVMLASMVTSLPLIVSHPILPPLGLMLLLAWRLLQPGHWPVWIGLPLGLFDDVFSGQPIGSAVLLWSLVMIGVDIADHRIRWRDYWLDWLIASIAITFALVGGLLIVNLTGGSLRFDIIMAQAVISIAFYPLIARLCASWDRWRLAA